MKKRSGGMNYTYPVVIGDIGGTNARFAIVETAGASPRFAPVLRTSDHSGPKEAIEAVCETLDMAAPGEVILAIAAPVIGEIFPMTNSDWTIDPEKLREELRLKRVTIMNDFIAQALAVDAMDVNKMRKIGGGEIKPGHPRIVMGPGTSFGMATMLEYPGKVSILPSEAGHVDMGLGTGKNAVREKQIEARLSRLRDRQVVDTVLCGPGLENLYAAICACDGLPAKSATAAQIVERAQKSDDVAASEAVSLFCELLGRTAGNFAISLFSFGGIYLAGGMSAKMTDLLQASSFRQAFEYKTPHAAISACIPTFIIEHELAALDGLAHFLNHPDRYDLSLACAIVGD